jgi:hypothetical protein
LQDRSYERPRERPIGTSPRLCIVSRERGLRWPELMAELHQTPARRMNSRSPWTDATVGPRQSYRSSRQIGEVSSVVATSTLTSRWPLPVSPSCRTSPAAGRSEGPTSAYPIEPSSLEDATVEDAEPNVLPPRASAGVMTLVSTICPAVSWMPDRQGAA